MSSASPQPAQASITASSISEAAKQPERKERDGNASELPAPPPEPEGRLQNVSPGGGTVPRDSSLGAGTTHTRTVAAPSDGSPCDERTRSAPEPAASTSRSAVKTAPAQQEAAPVPPPALPQLSEGDAEPMSHAEVDQDSFQPGFSQSQFGPIHQLCFVCFSVFPGEGEGEEWAQRRPGGGAAHRRVSVLPE